MPLLVTIFCLNVSVCLQPAHVKACFLGSNLTVPVSDGKLNLGTWQGVWLCEHRDRAGSRKVRIFSKYFFQRGEGNLKNTC